MSEKKQYEVLASNPESLKNVKGFVDDKNPGRPPMMLDRYGRALIKDSGIAKEIRSRFGAKKYGGDGSVTVVPVNKPREEGHTYTFLVPEMPWKRNASKREAEEGSVRRAGETEEGQESAPVQEHVDTGAGEDV